MEAEARRLRAGAGTSAAMAGFAQRMALFYGALFLIYGVHVPFMPVWLDFKGLTAGEIAVVTAAPQFLRLAVTPAVGLLADRHGAHRRLIIVLSWLALAVAGAMLGSSGFVALLVLSTAFQILISTAMPLTETVAVAGARAGSSYGRIRLWGSLTFIVASVAAGPLIDFWGGGVVAWLLIGATAATLACAGLLPHAASDVPREPAQGGAASAEARKLVRSPVFLLFLAAASAAMGSHAMLYTYGALHWRGQGISTTWISVLWGIGVICEIALFAWSGWFLRLAGIKGALVIGLAGCAVRWGLLALEPPLWVLVVLAPLHAFTYAATHLGAIHFIGRAVPAEAAGTAQALYSALAAGVASGAMTLALGAVHGTLGGGAGYFMMAAVSAAGLAAAVVIARRWDGGLLWKG